MPQKPRKPATRATTKVNQNEPNPFRVAFARVAMASGMSYSQTRAAIVLKFGCHKATAERDIAVAKIQNKEITDKALPELLARKSAELDEIQLLAKEDKQYTAAVGAVREFARINGMHVEVIAIGPTSPEQQAMVNALVMTPYQRQKRIAELKGEAPPEMRARRDADVDDDADE